MKNKLYKPKEAMQLLELDKFTFELYYDQGQIKPVDRDKNQMRLFTYAAIQNCKIWMFETNLTKNPELTELAN